MPDKLKPDGTPTLEEQISRETPLLGDSRSSQRRRGPNPIWIVLGFAALIAVGWFVSKKQRTGKEGPATAGPARSGAGGFAVPVIAGVVQHKEVPIYLDGLGTVQAFNSVMVRTRVDGQLVKVAFVEGQDVRVGDLLAQV